MPQCNSGAAVAGEALQEWEPRPGGLSPGVALPGTLRQRSRVPPKLGLMAPIGAPSAWQHLARRPADTRRARPNWERDRGLARTVGSNRGGDADPDPTLACSRAAHRGGLDSPLRRLTTIPDGPSWRRDPLAARPRQRIRSADGAFGVRPLCRQVWGAASQPRRRVRRPADAAVQQQPQPVVGEVATAVAGPLDLLDEQVDGLGGAVGAPACGVEGEDLGFPGPDGAGQAGQLWDPDAICPVVAGAPGRRGLLACRPLGRRPAAAPCPARPRPPHRKDLLPPAPPVTAPVPAG